MSKEQIAELKKQYKLLTTKNMKKREHGDTGYTKRNQYQRDYTRVLYSSAFRRLQGKMQILGVRSTAFFRNRLTHSLEVSQIARSIATNIAKACKVQNMYVDDMYVIEAAALAHDIGHPAFGHKGEKVLDELAKKSGLRFEGNAQNFTVLRMLEKKEPTITGINLTYRTLLAINKYLVKENKSVKKFMYTKDYDDFNEFRNENNLFKTRTLDVQIIDVADEIAYAIHDLEDGLALRYFTIDELLYEIKQKDERVYDILNKVVGKARDYSLKSNSYKTLQEYSQVFRKRLTSVLTYNFINDVSFLPNTDLVFTKEHGTKNNQYELSLVKYNTLSMLLREMIFECINRDYEVILYEQRGEMVIRSLFELFSDDQCNHNGMLLPPDYRPREGYPLKRGAIDYIAGMMDTFAISEYERLFGIPFEKIDVKETKRENR